MRIIDTHCHPHMSSHQMTEYRHLPVVCSTNPNDWDAVKNYAPVAARCFGLHPWWVATEYDELISLLRTRLETDSQAFVGEIGLDGLRRETLNTQETLFRQQFALAAELQRPVTLHCVRAYGRMRTAIEEAECLPPAISMHSYGGSYDFGRDLISITAKKNCHLFFGFSWTINGQRSKPQYDLIRALPDNSILLESDLEDSQHIDSHLEQACQLIAKSKQWSQEFTYLTCHQNALAFLRHIPDFDSSTLMQAQ